MVEVSTEQRNTAWRAATVFARLALAAGFLSAVADRFGLWGAAGTGQVAWGDFDAFLTYLHSLAPYLPTALVEVLGWAATVVEVVLGVALLLGFALRWSALAAFATLLSFALSMAVFSGPEAPLNASVFTAAAAALLLALAAHGDRIPASIGSGVRAGVPPAV
ncbi:DoxX family membrane protein [Nocardia halotolerans]|uniref:DoxX family membrane protein n=1 Tax=Nocardia halotolerans TaxID=1755878 RepID=A0ABV8VHK0_9NOCA